MKLAGETRTGREELMEMMATVPLGRSQQAEPPPAAVERVRFRRPKSDTSG